MDSPIEYDRIEVWDYDLPEDLIATFPSPEREQSRLMHVEADRSFLSHYSHFSNLMEIVREHDLLVFNNAKVVSARMHARKSTGGKVEIFALDVRRPAGENRWDTSIDGILEIEAMTRSSKPLRPGQILTVDPDLNFEILEWEAGVAHLRSVEHFETSATQVLERFGEMPLPPYILKEREQRDETYSSDAERYQTVYASKAGAVAAPTAGLHFTNDLIERLKERGVRTAFVTLHVSAGTFRPVTSELLSDHEMHEEAYEIPPELREEIARTRAAGGRVIAVGTTTVRTLESEARRDDPFEPGFRTTELFLKPGSEFDVVDAMITNFHLPRSTLLALVAAFCGYELMMRAYQAAIDERYRFYSYGDAMFLTRGQV